MYTRDMFYVFIFVFFLYKCEPLRHNHIARILKISSFNYAWVLIFRTNFCRGLNLHFRIFEVFESLMIFLYYEFMEIMCMKDNSSNSSWATFVYCLDIRSRIEDWKVWRNSMKWISRIWCFRFSSSKNISNHFWLWSL